MVKRDESLAWMVKVAMVVVVDGVPEGKGREESGW